MYVQGGSNVKHELPPELKAADSVRRASFYREKEREVRKKYAITLPPPPPPRTHTLPTPLLLPFRDTASRLFATSTDVIYTNVWCTISNEPPR